MERLFYASKYIRHRIKAKNSRGHGIHSPYLYRFTQNVVYEKNPYYAYAPIEVLRENLFYDDRLVSIKDYGTGNDRNMRVQEIAKSSLLAAKWGQLMFRLVNFSKAEHVLELGTSLGLTSAYMASVNAEVNCLSLEGSTEVAAVARENFAKLEISNVKIIEGDIDKTLDVALKMMPKPDVVFFDANHTYEATMRYFTRCLEQIHPFTVFVFDDIYWSREMTRAWRDIRNHPDVTAAFDLFRMGIIFFNPSYQKRTFRLRY